MKHNLYALLIGINEYPYMPPQKQLTGCLNDVAAVEQYLEQPFVQAAFEKVVITKMTSPAPDPALLPVKKNVVRQFTDFLGQAGPEDTIWFYFSGHGVREQTNIEAFKRAETDGNIAGLAMRDFNGNAPNVGPEMLCDKEIRYLMQTLARKHAGAKPPHILMMLDCCHSGESTRSGGASNNVKSLCRQIDRVAYPARQEEDFLFYDDTSVRAAMQTAADVETFLPEAPHVMLGACLPVELCWENMGPNDAEPPRGVFNRHVFDILTEQQGRVSYDTLYRRVLNRIRFQRNQRMLEDDRQTPQLYVQSGGYNHRQRQFLTNDPTENNTFFPVDFAPHDDEWRVGAGLMHGLQAGTSLRVEHPQVSGKYWDAVVRNLYADKAGLSWQGEMPPTDWKNYQTKLPSSGVQPLSLFIEGEAAQHIKPLLEAKIGDSATYIKLTAEEEAAHYTLHASNDRLALTLPRDAQRPVVEPWSYSAEILNSVIEEVAQECNQIARWTFLRDLEYRAPGLDKPVVELRVYEKTGEGQERLLPLADDRLWIALSKNKPSVLLRFELVNNSTQSYHASLVYMSAKFGFLANKDGLMERPTLLLEKGNVLKSRSDTRNPPYFSFSLSDTITRDGWPEENAFLKLIYSKTPYDIEQFNMSSITKRTGVQKFGNPVKKPSAQNPEWEIRTFAFTLENEDVDKTV